MEFGAEPALFPALNEPMNEPVPKLLASLLPVPMIPEGRISATSVTATFATGSNEPSL